MIKKYDYLIVGAGLYGSTFARLMTDKGKKCLVIDKRNHIAGNCYTEKQENINVHKYGPHIFHTDDENVWKFINRFATFNDFILKPKINYKDKIYSFPINLMTFQQVFGFKYPKEAINYINNLNKIENPKNFEEKAISQIGEKLYKMFFYGYTKKQWGLEPKELPEFIFNRLPIRFKYNENYFNDKYQGIPIGGYTELFKKMLYGIEVNLNVDYIDNKEYFDSLADNIVYTGKIDEFFDYKYDDLDYRTLYFEQEILDIDDYQGNAVMNYTDKNILFTRIIEHNHFENSESVKSIITKEYSKQYKKNTNDIPYYPINNKRNNKLYLKYKKLANKSNIIFGGRLAEYKYYDMDDTIKSVFEKINEMK